MTLQASRLKMGGKSSKKNEPWKFALESDGGAPRLSRPLAGSGFHIADVIHCGVEVWPASVLFIIAYLPSSSLG